jgi:hypothetical protein
VAVELEILDASRGFTDAQIALEGEADPEINPVASVPTTWYDTGVDANVGCFALIRDGVDELEHLVGEIVRVFHKDRSVFVYVLGGADLPETVDFALARTAWLLGVGVDLAIDEISVRIEVRL